MLHVRIAHPHRRGDCDISKILCIESERTSRPRRRGGNRQFGGYRRVEDARSNDVPPRRLVQLLSDRVGAVLFARSGGIGHVGRRGGDTVFDTLDEGGGGVFGEYPKEVDEGTG